MKNCLKNILIEKINSTHIEKAKDYLLLLDFENATPLPIFYLNTNKFYPVTYSWLNNEDGIENNVKAIFSEDIVSLCNFIIAIRGLENLSFSDKLLISRFLESHEATFGTNLSKYFPLLSLPEKGLFLLSKNKLSPDLALKLNSFTQKDKLFFFELIERFNLTINLQKELFDFVSTKAKKENLSFEEVLNELVELKKDLTVNELITKIRKKLMPEYMATKEKFLRLKGEIKLPKKTNLVETPFFENKQLKIEIYFNSVLELKEVMEKLKLNLDNNKKKWDEIFDLL